MTQLSVLIIFTILTFGPSLLGVGQISVNSSCVNGECYVQASTSLVSICAAVLTVIFLLKFPRKQYTRSTVLAVLIRQRLAAIFIDFWIVLSFISILALPVLLVEASFTGNFVWNFERDFSRPTDDLLFLPLVLLVFVILFLYHFIHLKTGLQTIGQYIAGYIVEAKPENDSRPAFGFRLVLGYIGLSLWPFSIYYALKKKDKSFWWENATDTRSVCVQLIDK